MFNEVKLSDPYHDENNNSQVKFDFEHKIDKARNISCNFFWAISEVKYCQNTQ